MKGFNKLFLVLLALFLVIVLPVFDPVGEESKGKAEAENPWTLQESELIEEQKAIAAALGEAKWRLAQLEEEYEAALLSGDSDEIGCLLDQIATEKSNISMMEREMKNMMKKMNQGVVI
ncbi:MAG: hypothetical protein ACOYI2_04305 [Bacillota bacterium]|nr:hypothetical protein [Clostridia bacterium]